MANQPHDRPAGNGNGAHAFAEAQQVVQPSPSPVTWLAALAEFPDPVKGTTQRLVVLDAYHSLGMQRAFLEPGAAAALAARLTEAAKMAENKGVQVVEGAAAHQIARQARGGPNHG
jgi:hypothetical protein